MNWESNWGPLSWMIFWGMPWNLKTWSLYIFAILSDVIRHVGGNGMDLFREFIYKDADSIVTLRFRQLPYQIR